MKTEKHLQSYLRRRCRFFGISFDKVESRSRRGFPDCFLAYMGRVVLVELKSPAGTGRLHPLQKVTIADLADHAIRTEVIDSAEGVDSLLAEMLEWENTFPALCAIIYRKNNRNSEVKV